MTKNKQKPKKDPNVYPRGLNRKKVEAIIAYYDAHQDEDLIDDAEVVHEPPLAGQMAWMQVPFDLVPEVKKLINRRRKSA
jgi:hypothetical protein